MAGIRGCGGRVVNLGLGTAARSRHIAALKVQEGAMRFDDTAPARRAIAADAADLARLAAESFRAKFGHLYPPAVLEAYVRDTYAEPRTAALIADPAVAVWVVAAAKRLMAFTVLAPCKLPHPGVTPACVELRRLYTAPDATGAGLGTRLMQAVVLPACAAAAARGGDAWVGVYSDNVGAQRFYARHGFAKAGEYWFPVGPVRDREFILRRTAR